MSGPAGPEKIRLGDILDVQIYFSLNIMGPGSPYIDRNAPHFGLALRGGLGVALRRLGRMFGSRQPDLHGSQG